MPIMRLRQPSAVGICDSDSGKMTEASTKQMVVMEKTMLLDSKGRLYVDVIILTTACTCVGHHDGKTCKPPKLQDRQGGEVGPPCWHCALYSTHACQTGR